MNIRHHIAAMAAWGFGLALLAGCQHPDDSVGTDEASAVTAPKEATASVPSIDAIEQTVSLDEGDRAVVIAALEDWQRAATGPATEPFSLHHAGMEFIAAVAPSLDNDQLSDLVDYLREYREAHEQELHHAKIDSHLAKLSQSLGLSVEQQSAMEALHDRMRAEMRELHEGRRSANADSDAIQESIKDFRDSHREKLAAILTEAQLAKLDQLRDEHHARISENRIQHMGTHTDRRVEWLKDVLGLTSQQEAVARSVLEESAKTRMQALEASRDHAGAGFGQIHKEHDAVIAALKQTLTSEQSERLEILRRLHLRASQGE